MFFECLPNADGNFFQGAGTASFDTADFDRIEVFLRDGNDTFELAGDVSAPTIVDAAAGTDTIAGPDLATTWRLTGSGAGSIGSIEFINAESLSGGGNDDRFAFDAGASFGGVIDGGAGTNTLDYTQYTTGVTVDLQLGAAEGTTGVANIQNVEGGSGDDSLVGGPVFVNVRFVQRF